MSAKYLKGENLFRIPVIVSLTMRLSRGKDISVGPILVGAINKEKEEAFGDLLSPYLARQDTFCVVSSDFCHW